MPVVRGRRIAELDPLSGLLNRAALIRRVTTTRSIEVPPTALFCDLDGFKAVNDLLGHATGDLIPWDVAARLQRCVHNDDLLARLGGDEFLAILQDCDESPEGERTRYSAEACGCSSMVEHQLPKLNTRVRFSSPALSEGSGRQFAWSLIPPSLHRVWRARERRLVSGCGTCGTGIEADASLDGWLPLLAGCGKSSCSSSGASAGWR